MKIAILTTECRDFYNDYRSTVPYFSTPVEALLQGFSKISDLEVHLVSCVRARVFTPEKLAPNVYFHPLYVPKIGWMQTAYSGCVYSIRRKLLEISPSLVHGQGSERECAIAAAFSGYPNVVTLHGIMRQVASALRAKPFSFLWLAARLESFAVKRAGGVVCLTGYTRLHVKSLAHKTWILPNAVNDVFYKIERRPDPQPLVLCVANIAPYKNQNELIRSLDSIASKKAFRLVFTGRVNPAHSYGKEFLELVKARPWCVHEGFKVGAELRAYFQTASLLVLPTLEDNCPMVLLEAMAAGLPVAASRIGGIPDLINHGVEGLLFDPRKPAEICAAVLQVLSNPASSGELALAAKRRSLQNHHPARIAVRHLEIYAEVINNRS